RLPRAPRAIGAEQRVRREPIGLADATARLRVPPFSERATAAARSLGRAALSARRAARAAEHRTERRWTVSALRQGERGERVRHELYDLRLRDAQDTTA